MMILTLLLAAGDPATTSRYDTMTAAERRCVRDPASTDITVCGMRNADRFRVPFVGLEPGNPQIQDVGAERRRLIKGGNGCREKSLFLVGCGSFGVTVGTRKGFAGNRVREVAP